MMREEGPIPPERSARPAEVGVGGIQFVVGLSGLEIILASGPELEHVLPSAR
jgi:hypothetical protein